MTTLSRMGGLTVALALVWGLANLSGQGKRLSVGPLDNGFVMTHTGWATYPSGASVGLAGYPAAMERSADGKHLFVLTQTGSGAEAAGRLDVIDAATAKPIAEAPLKGAGLGIAVAPEKGLLYVSGGADASISVLEFSQGTLRVRKRWLLAKPESKTIEDFIGDVELSPDGRFLYAAGLFRKRIWVINTSSGAAIAEIPTGVAPRHLLAHPDGQRLFVTSWAEGKLYQHRVEDGSQIGVLRLGPHPGEIVLKPGQPETPSDPPDWKERLFIPSTHSNTLYTVGLDATHGMALVETLPVAFTPRQPVGMMPASIALAQDGKRLYVACSGANAVAVADVEGLRTSLLGFLPAGLFPASVQEIAGGKIAVANANGWGAATGKAATGVRPNLIVLPPFDLAALAQSTRLVQASIPYADEQLIQSGAPAGNPIPAAAGAPTPIRHVVYILKGGLRYDAVFGGTGIGAAARDGQIAVLPNHLRLAKEFTLLDNFHAGSTAPVEGEYWAGAAIVPDAVRVLLGPLGGRWPESAALYPLWQPPAGYLWTNAASRGISLRNYGWWVRNLRQAAGDGRQIANVLDPALEGKTNLRYRGPDPQFPDTQRAAALIAEIGDLEKKEQFPTLTLIRLENTGNLQDHDRAFGQVIESLSRSRFWPQMAIFVAEASGSTGPDHLDPHRAPAYVISPYARRGQVDPTFYTAASALRSIELLLGLHPMTHFDAAALPMANAFESTPDPRPYEAVP